MDKLKNYLTAAITMIVGAFLPYVYSYANDAQFLIYFLSIASLCFGFFILVLIQYRERTHRVKYALLLFVMDENNRLLTLYNQYHKRIMIPCGIIPSSCTPNEAVEKFLKEQVHIDVKDCKNCTLLTEKQIDTNVLHPYDAQIEFVTKHEKHVKLHYAFIYFIQTNSSKIKEHESIAFYNLEELEKMNEKEGLFSDLLARYKSYVQERG